MVKTSIVFRHIFIWLIFIGYEIACIKFTVGLHGTFIDFAAYYVLYISLFYVNSHVILDTAFFKTTHPYLISILLILTEVILFGIIKVGLDYIFLSNKRGFSISFILTQSYILSNVFREIFFIGFSIAYWSMLYMVKFKERNHLMETEQLKSMAKNLELENKYMSVENAYLQNQISPHLLFNTLNFIYTTVRGQSKDAGEGVSRLSDLMRYSLVSADDTRLVSLADEVTQMENLVELCRMRFGELFYLRFHQKGKLTGIRIIPLVLITLVENMMKHGDLGEKKRPARISLEVAEDRLVFSTSNKKRNTSLYPKGGLGLRNIEKRLNNYYQERYSLLREDDGEIFTVTLTLTNL